MPVFDITGHPWSSNWMMFCDGKQNKSNKKESGIRKARKPCNLALLYIYNTFFILAFVFVVSEKKNWPLTFWTWRPLLKIWEPDVFLRKKVNFVPWEITWPYHLLIHQNIYFDILSIERLRQPPKHHSWYQFIQKIILYLDYVISTSLSCNQNENRNHAIQKVQTESRKWKISMQKLSQRISSVRYFIYEILGENVFPNL